MAEARSGMFTYKEFMYRRNVLKIAPDAFITIDGATGLLVASILDPNSKKEVDLRGGVTSITVNAAVNPPGASRATVEIIAPIYKGLHEDYYLTLPNGTRINIFRPMMEIKIYMKGRFLENNETKYYCAFWGMITGVQENYGNGVYTFTLNCEDLLVWWKYQKIDMRPSNVAYYFGGTIANRFPSAFTNMNPWDIITIMFFDTFFMQIGEGENPRTAYFNFMYPTYSGSGFLPEGIAEIKETYGPIAGDIINYWNNRFGFCHALDETDNRGTNSQVSLELFGVKGPLDVKSVRDRVRLYLNAKTEEQRKINDQVRPELDYTLLGCVQPFGSFDTYGDGAESQVKSKLEIATLVCSAVNMEFFVDTNGHIVFKPPFYNLDVLSGGSPIYKISSDDVINFNASVDTNSILTFLTVTGPYYQGMPSIELIGFHADFELMKKYGIRSEKMSVMYGMGGKQLRAIAAAEMARNNAQAFTGGVSIPLRPELRLGYPVYIEHLDSFYYVTGITHNITFGSSATTDLSLQCRRERVFDDGSSKLAGSKAGDVLKGCVMRNQIAFIQKIKDIAAKPAAEVSQYENLLVSDAEKQTVFGVGSDNTPISDRDLQKIANDLEKHIVQESNNFRGGPGDPVGYWKIEKATPSRISESMQNAGTPDATPNNELVIMTDTTIPYTDKMGYRHIGALPYGANLAIVPGKGLFNMLDPVQAADMATSNQIGESATNNTITTNTPGDQVAGTEPPKELGPIVPRSREEQEDLRRQFSTLNAPKTIETPFTPTLVQLDNTTKEIGTIVSIVSNPGTNLIPKSIPNYVPGTTTIVRK